MLDAFTEASPWGHGAGGTGKERARGLPCPLSTALPATSTLKDMRPPEPSHDLGTTGLLPAAATAPSSLAVRVLATPGTHASAGVASWLLCEVSGFSPPELLLTWQEGSRQVDSSWFATAAPTAEPGNSKFRTWSVLRVPATHSPPLATYTCEVRHTASGRLLNASWSLDTAGEAPPAQGWGRAGGAAAGGLCRPPDSPTRLTGYREFALAVPTLRDLAT